MRGLREKIARFMYGRYGTDSLNKALLWVYVAIFAAGFFVGGTARLVFTAVEILFALLLIFRTLSKNIYARGAENRKYLAAVAAVRRFFTVSKNRWRDRKTHVYKKCPHCKATLRLPRKSGRHTVACPRCKKDFEVKI